MGSCFATVFSVGRYLTSGCPAHTKNTHVPLNRISAFMRGTELERPMPSRLGLAGPSRASSVPAMYRPLHKYLDGRFAQTVVLTFAEIEDLIGAQLPDVARLEADWWSNGESDGNASPQSRCWTEASRMATPHMTARNVAFERATP